jgi:hypothetical protein
MVKEIVLIGETDMDNGVDLIHSWTSVEEALESERFSFLEEYWDEDSNDMSWEQVTQMTDLKEFIKKVSHPFYLVESED